MTNDLIKVDYQDENLLVSARELHDGLEIKTPYTMWFERVRSDYGFIEQQDFFTKLLESNGGRPMVEHMITVDMAKQICMIQRSEKGRLYRQYFLELEKAWNSPEQVMARALQMANASVRELQERCYLLNHTLLEQQSLIEAMQPKVRYLDVILQSPCLVLTTQIAKDYGMSAVTFNRMLKDLGIQFKSHEQWVLYAKYQSKGYTHSTTFVIKTNHGDVIKMQTEWTQKGRLFLYELLKAQGILPLIERGGEELAGRNHG